MGGIALVAIAAGEWLRGPAPGPVVVAALAALVVVATTGWGSSSWRERIAGLTALLLAATLAVAEAWRIRLDRSELERQTQLSRNTIAVTIRQLDGLREQLTRITERAGLINHSDPEAALEALERVRRGVTPSPAVAILGRDGAPLVWSGRFLTAPSRSGDSLEVIQTAFYVVLEVRRHRPDSTVAVASALLWRDPAVPEVVEPLVEPAVRSDDAAIRLVPAATAPASLSRWPAANPVLGIAVDLPDRAEAVSSHVARWSRRVGWLALVLLLASVLAGETRLTRLLPATLGVILLLRAPLGQALWPAAFAPASYFSRSLGPLSASAGALAAAGARAALIGTRLWYSMRLPVWFARAAGIGLALVSPYLTRELGRGITPPASGVPMSLWLVWHLAVLLPTVALTILACGLLRVKAPPGRPAFPVLGGIWSIAVAAVGVMVFTGRPGWPAWYTLLWLPAIVLVTRPAPIWATLVGVSLAAGSGASLITWGSALAGRTDLALSDLALLGTEPDPLAQPRLVDLGNAVAALGPAVGAPELYLAWRRSELHRERYPTRLMVWERTTPVVDVAVDAIPLEEAQLGELAVAAAPGQAVVRVASGPGVHHVLTRRIDSARVLVAAVAPRTQLVPPATLGRVLEGARPQLYRMAVNPLLQDSIRPSSRWRRENWSLRATRWVTLPAGPHEANMVIPLGRPEAIAVRGGLLLLGDVAIVLVVWLGGAWAAGVPIRLRSPVFRRSYETRLALALAVFFLVPAALLSALSVRQLAAEARQSRDLVMQRILRDAAAAPAEPVRETANRLDTSIGIYRDGLLVSASEPVLPALGLLPPVLEHEAWHALVLEGDPYSSPRTGGPVLTGYVPLAPRGGSPVVLGTVQPAGEQELGERQLDIAFFFVLATLLGLVAAVGAARFAARMLSRPVDELRQTALAFGRGLPVPALDNRPTREFEPVFDAFGRMAADIRAGQQALEAARRRTESVLATVSTGVVAVDGAGSILLANRTAEEMLGIALPRGRQLAGLLEPPWESLQQRLQSGAAGGDLELDAAGRRYVIRVAPLEGVDGWVLAVNDVTQTTRAARVLAWADVANQVAHAIKNPLTPLRLGIQHLRRVRERRPEHFDTALDETSERLLAEIDRLDAIARGFSRFAAPVESDAPLEGVLLKPVAEEVAGLHHLAPGLRIRVEIPQGATVQARRDELKEVLLNLCDNARNAAASTVVIRWDDGALVVGDDGRGIPPEVLPRIFEPRFSTTSSGSGLGLAIVRRVVEGWGAGIAVQSTPGKGAEFVVTFPPAQRNSSGAST